MNEENQGNNNSPENKTPEESKQTGRSPNWITDMYDKMNVPVKLLDALLIGLGVLIVLLFIFGNQIQLGI